MAEAWNVEVLAGAERVRPEALLAMQDRADEPFPFDAVQLRGHRNRFRIKFSCNRYRIIYEVSRKRRTVLIARVRRRTAETYRGY